MQQSRNFEITHKALKGINALSEGYFVEERDILIEEFYETFEGEDVPFFDAPMCEVCNTDEHMYWSENNYHCRKCKKDGSISNR